jgi:uncharacterized phage-associated protein
MAGGMEYNREKFEELIVYIARRLGPEAALGRVKLAKLLMLSDFTAFQRRGRAITGATYEHWEHGHLPHELILTEKDLLGSGRISKETVNYFGKKLSHITAGDREPDLSAFDEEEIGIVESVLRRYGHESATYLRSLSHQEVGWELTQEREEIPYGTALLPSGPPPDSLVAEYRELFGTPI